MRGGGGEGGRRALGEHDVALLLLRRVVQPREGGHLLRGVRAVAEAARGDVVEALLRAVQELEVDYVRLEVVRVVRRHAVVRLGLQRRALAESEGEGRHPADTAGNVLPLVAWEEKQMLTHVLWSQFYSFNILT